MSRTRRIIGGGALVLVVVAIAVLLYVRSSLPRYDGTVRLQGISAPVRVLRDKYAIPHIIAANFEDAAFAMGYVHAQDRLWQLEFNRRIGQGRLAEFLGPDALDTDKLMRTLGLYGRAQSAYEALDAKTKQQLNAYANGINSYITGHSGALPPEFLIFHIKPEPWKPADSLVWQKLMCLNLGYQWTHELQRFALSAKLNPAQVAEITNHYPGDAPNILPDPKMLFPDLPQLARVPESAEGKGSNNWVISGSRTVSGKPLLANDPHLDSTAPSIWYLAHIQVAGKNVVGVTLPSLPYIVLGRSDRVAWGFTNTEPDTQDIIVEKILDPKSGLYQRPDGTALLTHHDEIIKVKGNQNVPYTVRESANGPIISDALTKYQDTLGAKYVMALRWVVLKPTDTSVRAGGRLLEATSVASAMDVLRDFEAPEQNIVLADVDGNIGYFAPGRVPIRRKDNRTHGLMPQPGWEHTSDWIGEVPYDQLPKLFNPKQGYVATANHKVVGKAYPYTLTEDWELPDRYDRIVQLIEATAKHDITSVAAMQADITSAPQRNITQLLLKAAGTDIPKNQRDTLAAWDGKMGADQSEPALSIAWQRYFVKRITADKLGDMFKDHWKLRQSLVEDVLSGKTTQNWCDDVSTKSVETCHTQAVLAFKDANAELSTMMGKDWTGWRWGDVHNVVAQHRPFGKVPMLARWFDIRRRSGGSNSTVNVAHPDLKGDRPYDAYEIPSYRGIFDLSDLEKSRFVIPTGQSGNVFSKHYDDMADMWQRVQSITIQTTDKAMKAATVNEMRLVPEVK